jgi:hypothetical protein
MKRKKEKYNGAINYLCTWPETKEARIRIIDY